MRISPPAIESMLQVGAGVQTVAEKDKLTIFAPTKDAFIGTDLTQDPEKLTSVNSTHR